MANTFKNYDYRTCYVQHSTHIYSANYTCHIQLRKNMTSSAKTEAHNVQIVMLQVFISWMHN